MMRDTVHFLFGLAELGAGQSHSFFFYIPDPVGGSN